MWNRGTTPDALIQRLIDVEHRFGRSMPRIGSLEARVAAYHRKVSQLETRLDRELQRRRMQHEDEHIASHRGAGSLPRAEAPASNSQYWDWETLDALEDQAAVGTSVRLPPDDTATSVVITGDMENAEATVPPRVKSIQTTYGNSTPFPDVEPIDEINAATHRLDLQVWQTQEIWLA